MSLYRKSIAALLTGMLGWGTSVTVSANENITAGEWVQLAGVLVGSFLVWFLPNEDA